MPLHSWLAPADTKGTRKVTVNFPAPPPEKGKVATIPKEALYPLAIVLPIVALIIVLTAKWWLSLILIALFAGMGFALHKKFLNPYFEGNHSALEGTFLEPIRTRFHHEGIDLSNHQIAYLWNYEAVKVSRSQKILIENDWAEGAVFLIETS